MYICLKYLAGTTQHAGNVSYYGPQWGKGAIVGVHLDTWRGKLEFFLNREPLGQYPLM